MRSIKENWRKKLNNLDGILFDIWIWFGWIIFFLNNVEIIPVASPHWYHSQILTNNTEKQTLSLTFPTWNLCLSLPESWRQHYFHNWEEYSRIRISEYIELFDVAKYVHVEAHGTNETDEEV